MVVRHNPEPHRHGIDPATRPKGADSGRRALEILFTFTERRPLVSVRQISDELGIPVPSVHRYIAMLREMGLIEERGRGQYHLTMQVATLGRAARQVTPIVELAEPHMRELVEVTGESATLIRLVHRRPVCIHQAESFHHLRLSYVPGQQMPPLRGSSIRLLLGNLTPAQREKYVDEALASGALPPLNGRDQFLRDVEQDIARGLAISDEELDQGIWAASSAITDGTETVALTAQCAAFRLDDAKKDTIVDLVRETAAAISQTLGA